MNRLQDGRIVFSGILVAPLDGHRLPVGPVDKILEDGQGEDVLERSKRI